MNEPTPPPIDFDDITPEAPVTETTVPEEKKEETLLYQPCEKPPKAEPSTPSFLSGIRRSFWE